jgi:flavin reductase (DIM6/NTAB) family NADH-FMN oxidoreductase RutF
MREIDPNQVPVSEVKKIMQGGISPRPIALVSTLSKDGIPNLSPFSYYNMAGYNPPIVVFSASRRDTDGRQTDTYTNLMETKECVIQAVTYSIVEQVSLASNDYPSNVDEFLKSGFNALPSKTVAPPRVKESPFQMECKLLQMIPLGEKAGSGNLAVCQVTYIHVAREIMTRNLIDPIKLDLVGRVSEDSYTRILGNAIFQIEKPYEKHGIGFDSLPDFMKNSTIYTGNDLARFANVEELTTMEEAEKFLEIYRVHSEGSETESLETFYKLQQQEEYKHMLRCLLSLSIDNSEKQKLLELTAIAALRNADTDFAWKTALLVALI